MNIIKKLLVGLMALYSLAAASAVSAGVLQSGGEISAHLAAGDIDNYTFSGNAGEAVTIIMEENSVAYGRIYLYRPDGSYWTFANNVVHVTLPVSGTYTASVRFSNTIQSGNYTMRYVRGGDAVENGSLQSGATTQSSLSAFDMDSYTFSGAAGEAVTLILDENVASFGRIYVYRPDGSYWTFGNNLLHLTLPQTGIYTAVIRLSSVSDETDYSLHYVLGGDDVENTNLVSGTRVVESLSTYDMDSYTFDGNAGEAVTLIMGEEKASYGRMYVYRPDGSYWTFGNNLLHLTLSQTGEYTVVVRFSSLADAGDYALDYVRGNAGVEYTSLTSGATHDESLSMYDMDSYTFDGKAGEAVTLIMDEELNSYGRIYIYRPDGSYWTFGNNLLHLTLPQTGKYTVVVRLSSLTDTGDYSLNFVRAGAEVENGDLTSGTSRYGLLNIRDMDSYNFSGNAGDAVTLIMDEEQASYGRIYIYRPDGSYWTFGNNLLHLTLPVTGQYTVVVRYSSLADDGDYSLHYVRASGGVENGSLNFGDSNSGVLNAYDMDSYTVSGLAGQEVFLNMSESTASYGRIYIYRPDGSYWTFGNNNLHLTLPESGTYTVVLRYSNLTSNGAYNFSYSLIP